MANQTLGLESQLYNYLLAVSLRETKVLAQLRQATATSQSMAQMQIAPEQGQFMALLIQLIGAKKTLDIGVFTGYSALVVALALPQGGKVVACEINREYAEFARHWWQKAGVIDKIDLHLAPAQDTLALLIANGEVDSFDFAFIDADKSNYNTYYEQALQLVCPGGLIAIDNVLWSGDICRAPAQSDILSR